MTAVRIVTASDAPAVILAAPPDRPAAEELAHYIELATGAKLRVNQSAAQGQTRILVGAASCPPEVRQSVSRLRRGGYIIRTIPGGALALAGNGPDGTAFAVYAFLQKYVGVRWLWPGPLGEQVPHRTSLIVDAASSQREPAYVWRDLGPGGALWGSMDKWTAERKLGVTEEHQRIQKIWARHNGFGGPHIYGGHAFGEILPPAKYGPEHPEYYALVKGQRDWKNFDGKHRSQPCTSNPDVIRLTTDYARRFFDQHPDFEAFAISLNDGGGFCECDRCRRLDSGKVEVTAEDPEGGKGGRKAVITDRIVTFANAVAEGVAKAYPDKKLILFAYGPYRQPPVRVKPHDNLLIQYTFHASRNWDPEAEQQQFKETGAWSGVAKQLGIYEYFIQGNSPDLPRLMPEPVHRSLIRLYEQGYRYYQTQAGDGYAVNGLNYYVLGRLLWDPSESPGAIQTDFIANGFGSAAPAIARYFNRWEEAWKSLAGKPVAMDAATAPQYRSVVDAYPESLLAQCRKDLDEASRLVSGREKERVEFLRRGLRYVDLTVEAARKTLPLLESGWRFAPAVTPPAKPDEAAFDAALAAWKERDSYVESLKQDFVISYFWVRYNDEYRSFVPLKKMLAYRKAQ
jgi:hypothetical protein